MLSAGLLTRWARIRTTPSIVRHCCWIIVVPRLHCGTSDHDRHYRETITQVEDVKRESYGIELGMIQDMYEAGDINRAQARSLRRNIYVMQVDADSGI